MDDLVTMLEAGVAEDIIAQKVGARGLTGGLSIADTKRLQLAGASEDLVAFLNGSGTAPGGATNAVPPSTGGPDRERTTPRTEEPPSFAAVLVRLRRADTPSTVASWLTASGWKLELGDCHGLLALAPAVGHDKEAVRQLLEAGGPDARRVTGIPVGGLGSFGYEEASWLLGFGWTENQVLKCADGSKSVDRIRSRRQRRRLRRAGMSSRGLAALADLSVRKANEAEIARRARAAARDRAATRDGRGGNAGRGEAHPSRTGRRHAPRLDSGNAIVGGGLTIGLDVAGDPFGAGSLSASIVLGSAFGLHLWAELQVSASTVRFFGAVGPGLYFGLNSDDTLALALEPGIGLGHTPMGGADATRMLVGGWLGLLIGVGEGSAIPSIGVGPRVRVVGLEADGPAFTTFTFELRLGAWL